MDQEPVGEVEYEYAGTLLIDQRVKWANGALSVLKSGDKLYVASCRNQCMDFCLTESLQERIAEQQAQLERYKAVMDEIKVAIQINEEDLEQDEVRGEDAFKNLVCAITGSLARYNTLKGE